MRGQKTPLPPKNQALRPPARKEEMFSRPNATGRENVQISVTFPSTAAPANAFHGA